MLKLVESSETRAVQVTGEKKCAWVFFQEILRVKCLLSWKMRVFCGLGCRMLLKLLESAIAFN